MAKTNANNQEETDETKELDRLIDGLLDSENRYYWTRIAVSVVFYVIPLVVYCIVIGYNEDDELKGVGIQTAVFLLASDSVVFTLKEQAISFKGEQSQVLFVYDTLF